MVKYTICVVMIYFSLDAHVFGVVGHEMWKEYQFTFIFEIRVYQSYTFQIQPQSLSQHDTSHLSDLRRLLFGQILWHI